VSADFQTSHHEIEQTLPTGKVHVAQECPDIIEEGLAGWQLGANPLIVLVGKGQESVEEKGQDIHGRKQRGKVLLAMTETMFQMIALGLEGVVVFVLDFPSCPSRGHQGGHILLGNFEVGDERMAIKHLALGIGTAIQTVGISPAMAARRSDFSGSVIFSSLFHFRVIFLLPICMCYINI